MVDIGEKFRSAFNSKNKVQPQISIPEIAPVNPAMTIEPPIEIVQPEVPKTPEQIFSEKCQETIDRLDAYNQKSLETGNNRLGFKVGEGNSETFLLNVPLSQDIQIDTGATERLHTYVMFTKEGVRGVVFIKGIVDESGELNNTIPGLTEDERYDGGETSFRIKLEEWTAKNNDRYWEPKLGLHKVKIEDQAPYPVQTEVLRLPNNEYYNTGKESGPFFLTSDIKPEMVSEAVKKSKEFANTELNVETPPQQIQIQLMEAALAEL